MTENLICNTIFIGEKDQTYFENYRFEIDTLINKVNIPTKMGLEKSKPIYQIEKSRLIANFTMVDRVSKVN